MSGTIDWLLGTDRLHWGQEGVEFGFAHPIPAWGWALVILGAGLLAWRSYAQMEGGGLGRGLLALGRGVLLLLLAVLIAGPRLVKANETEEKDWVLVLVDRSASLAIGDVTQGSGRMTRDEQLRRALKSSGQVWEELGKERVVVWLGFAAGAFDLKAAKQQSSKAANETNAGGTSGELPVELGGAVGRRTALGRSLEQALKRAAARPVSGVVVLSDGRSVDEAGRAVLRQLAAEKVPVFTVPLGSSGPMVDLAVRSAEGPRSAFVDDLVPVEVEVERLGSAGAGNAPWGKVQLIDEGTGAVLDERPVGGAAEGAGVTAKAGEQVARLTLTTRPKEPGERKWTVRVVPEGGPGADLVSENNTAAVAVELVDRPLRVAYFDGYPRWEYRYLKNLLLREKSVKSSSLILSSGRRFVQEGDAPLDKLPTSPEEWREFDVIVMGDLRPEVFTTEQLEQIKQHVALRGAGLIWIGGEGSTPGAWKGTPLADLLPFTTVDGTGGEGTIRAWGEPVVVSPTPLADRLGVLRLSSEEKNGSWWPEGLSDPAMGWSALYWAQRIEAGSLKPTAEVLARARAASQQSSRAANPEGGGGDESAALIVSMRYGAGRVLYVGTDEIWRWRYGRGEFLPERFWLQMVRLLGRESVARSGKAARLEVTPRRAEVEQPVRVGVTLIDQALVDGAPASVRVRLERIGDVGKGPGDQGGPAAGGEREGVEMTLAPEGGGAGAAGEKKVVQSYAGTWVATESGRYRIRVMEPALAAAGGGGAALESEAEVWLPEDELRHPETDHPLLARLSQETGGKVLKAEELGSLPGLLPNRKVRLVGEPDTQTLWDTPLALMIVVLLLTLEWVGRRLMKLA